MWRSAENAGTAIRFLDTTLLGRSLRKRIQRLDQGEAPTFLGLGKDIVQPAAGDLLAYLLRHWREAPSSRQFPCHPFSRPQAATGIDVAIGMAAAHSSISGKPFADGRKPWEYSRRNAERIHVFQHLHPVDVEGSVSVSAQSIERWIPLDESANGFRLQRAAPGAKLAVRHLLSLRPQGARHFILAEVRWLAQGKDSSLVIGASALPGLATAVAACDGLGDPMRPPPFSQAFLLSVGGGLPPIVVLPSGWYQRDRVLEIRKDEGSSRIRLTDLRGRGADYDRASFCIES